MSDRKLNDAFTDSVPVCDHGQFSDMALEIFSRAMEQISATLSPKETAVLASISSPNKQIILDEVRDSFFKKRMGYRELSALAERRIYIFLVEQQVPRFSVKRPSGHIGAVQYFSKYYSDLFKRYNLPIKEINLIDPNLSTHLKKSGKFCAATKILNLEPT